MKHLNEFINESSEKYEIVFLQYDPDVQAEYEDGDATEDDLHDSMYENEDIEHVFITAANNRDAERRATKELAKVVNKHPEICGCTIYDATGTVIENIFI